MPTIATILHHIIAWVSSWWTRRPRQDTGTNIMQRAPPIRTILIPTGSERAPLMVHPRPLPAWVFEDITGMHRHGFHGLANATELPHVALIARNNRRNAVASPSGLLLLCPISLSHIYWWDCVCIGSPPSVFSCVHLAQFFISTGDFRHPITREDITPSGVGTIAKRLKRSGRRQLAKSLLITHNDRHTHRAAIALQAEAVVVYDNAISILLHDLLECLERIQPNRNSNGTLSIFAPLLDSAQADLGNNILSQYTSYTRLTLRDATVASSTVRAVLTNHSCILMRILVANTQFYEAHSLHQALAFHATREFAGLYTHTFEVDMRNEQNGLQ
jgi:hypothetical protein